MTDRALALSPYADDVAHRHARAAAHGSNDMAPGLQRALAAGQVPLRLADLMQLQRTAGNRAVQRLVAGPPTVQRQPTPKPAGADKAPVKVAGPVGGASGKLPPGSKVTVAPPTTKPAAEAGKKGGEEEEKDFEFHAEVSGTATVEKAIGGPAESKFGSQVDVGVEAPNATPFKPTKFGGGQLKFLTNPELHVKLGGALDTEGKVSGSVRAELGIDLARLVVGPWSFRLAAIGGEVSTGEGLVGKVAVGAEKEVPKTGGLGLKSELNAGMSLSGQPSGEGTVRLLYALPAGKSTQVFFFGEGKGSVARDGSEVKAEGTTFLGAGVKF